jgi:hypothetical protein
MGWSIGFDERGQRDVGYGVPAICDHPECSEGIDRGLSYVCGGELYGGEHGCGLYFCSQHLFYSRIGMPQRCERCCDGGSPFDLKPDVREWIFHKLTDESWQRWRSEHPSDVARLVAEYAAVAGVEIVPSGDVQGARTED